jgi:hypothetical protein
LARRLLDKAVVRQPDEHDPRTTDDEIEGETDDETDDEIDDEQGDLSQAELGAVSEHSLRSAGYSSLTQAAEDAGYGDDFQQRDDDTPDETPAGMGRNLLEEATEAPGSKGSRAAKDTRAPEEAAVHQRPGPAR